MKKRKYFLLTLCLLLNCLFSCSKNENNSSLSIDTKKYHGYVMVNYDYGMHIKNKLTLLFDSYFPYFDIKDYGIDKVIGGDVLEITFLEDFYCQETYPGVCNIKEGNITNVTLYKGNVIEFKIENVNGQKSLVKESNQPTIYKNINIIDKDESFHTLDYFDEGMIVYGINPAIFSSLNCVCFYSYNPYLE